MLPSNFNLNYNEILYYESETRTCGQKNLKNSNLLINGQIFNNIIMKPRIFGVSDMT